MTHLIFPTSGDVLIHGHSIRTDTQAALSFEGRRMLTSKSTLIYVIIYLTSYIILVIFFQLYGSDGSVLTEASAQSFPIQHLQAGTLFTGTFIAIYVAQITRQERTQGTIKLILLRPMSRLQYYISRILSIAFFSVLLTLIQITVGYWYLVGMLFFGWHGTLVFGSMVTSGPTGVGITFLSGLAFAFAYFAFGMLMMLLFGFLPRLIDCAAAGIVILGYCLICGFIGYYVFRNEDLSV